MTRLFTASAFLTITTLASPAFASDVGELDKVQVVYGDFDGDSNLDLAAGDPTYGSNAGAVGIAYDFAAYNGFDQAWDRDSSGILETAQADDYFGSALAVGDFDGDGFDDLAIGVPGDDHSATDGGSVTVLYGSSSGLTSTGNQFWHQNVSGILDSIESYDYFGEFLAAGDFNCDGYDDLAIGVPQENIGTVSDAGAVHIIYGSSSGLVPSGNQFWHQDSSGIDDTAESSDNFGGALAAGNFNGDLSGVHACADLAIGASGETVNSNLRAGAVNVIYGTSSGLTSTGSQFWHQDVAGIVDATALRDTFGARLAAHDDDADGYDDLEVFVPGESTCSSSDEGLHTIYGGSSGLSTANDYLYCGPDDEPQALSCSWTTYGGVEQVCHCTCKIGSFGCGAWAAANWFVGAGCSVVDGKIKCVSSPSKCD